MAAAPILDNFNRANGSVGSNWTADPTGESRAIPQIASNRVYDGAGSILSAWWNVETFGSTVEVRATITDWAANSGQGISLLADLTDPDTGSENYFQAAFTHNAGSGTQDNIGLFRVSAGAGTTTLTTLLTPDKYQVGDEIRLQVFSNGTSQDRLVASRKRGGVWTNLASSVASPLAPGYVGFYHHAFYGLDDFAGGEIVDQVAFGGTGLIDDFDRANGGVGSNYSTDPYPLGHNAPLILSNSLSSAVDPPSGAWWDVEEFGADQEVYMTLSDWNAGASDSGVLLLARMQDPGGSSNDHYLAAFLRSPDASLDYCRLYKVNAGGSSTQLGTTALPTNYQDGDVVGLTCVGDQITAWRRRSGVTTPLIVVTNTLVTDAGYIGWHRLDADFALDDLGGGIVHADSLDFSDGAIQIADPGGVTDLGGVTIAAVVKLDLHDSDEGILTGIGSGAMFDNQWRFQLRAYLDATADRPELSQYVAGTPSAAQVDLPVYWDTWHLIAVTKPAGTSVARFHVYDGTSWSRANSPGSISDGVTAARLTLGGFDVYNSFDGDILAIGYWDSILSDSEVEELVSESEWGSAVEAWLLNTMDPVQSFGTVGEAHETSRTGTTALTGDLPSWWGASGDGVGHTATPSDGIAFSDAGTVVWTANRSTDDQLVFTDSVAKVRTKRIADGIGFTDTRARTVTWHRTRADTIAFTDARAATRRRTVSDTFAFTDARARTVTWHRSRSDAIGFTDLATPVKGTGSVGHTRSVPDTFAFTDARTFVRGRARIVSDAIGFTDARARAMAKRRTVSDAIAFTDVRTRVATYHRTRTDSIAFTDARAATRRRTVSDSFALTDARARTVTWHRSRADTFAFTDARAIRRTRTVTDAIGFTDTRARAVGWKRTGADAIAFTDTRRATRTIARADAIAFTDARARTVTWHRALADGLALTDARSRIVTRVRQVADAIAFTDLAILSGTGAHSRSVSDSIVFTDQATRRATYRRTRADGLALTDAQSKRITKARADAIAFTDARSIVRSRVRTISDSIAFTDARTRVTVKRRTVSDALALTDARTRRVTWHRTIPDGMAFSDHTDVVGAGVVTRTVADAISFADALEPVLFTLRTVADSIVFTDASARRKAVTRLRTDTLSFTDAVARTGTSFRTFGDNIVFTDVCIPTRGAPVEISSPFSTSAGTRRFNIRPKGGFTSRPKLRTGL